MAANPSKKDACGSWLGVHSQLVGHLDTFLSNVRPRGIGFRKRAIDRWNVALQSLPAATHRVQRERWPEERRTNSDDSSLNDAIVNEPLQLSERFDFST